MTPTNLKVLCCTKPEIAKRDEKRRRRPIARGVKGEVQAPAKTQGPQQGQQQQEEEGAQEEASHRSKRRPRRILVLEGKKLLF
jgi:hypothetical protein